jgi:uncharacterized Fe-S cluster-containing protein
MSEIDQTLQDLDEKLDEVDEIIMSLPIRGDKKKRISALVYQIYSETEAEIEVMSSDWEA